MMRIARTATAAAMGLALFAGAASAAPAGLAGNLPAAAPAAATLPFDEVTHRGGGSVTFHFGVGPGYYYGPRYHGPRYYPRRYHAPRYHAPRHYRPARASAHVRWCSSRYRSYRAWDNTFQPYNGPRRQCVSPYF